MQNIFTYGSLMFAQVWEKVVRGRYRAEPATAHDHARHPVIGATYPGMVPAAGQAVRGVLYFDVAPADVAALDAFEGGDYRLEPVMVRLDSGAQATAGAYIFLDAQRLAGTDWDPRAFRMREFMAAYCRPHAAE